MGDEQVTIGEIARRMERQDQLTTGWRTSHHEQLDQVNESIARLSDKMDRYIGPVAVLQKQAQSSEEAMLLLTSRITAVENQAARVWGIGAALGFAAGLLSRLIAGK